MQRIQIGKWKITLGLFFHWCDLWIGMRWDRKARMLHICPLPMLGVRLWFQGPLTEKEAQGIFNLVENAEAIRNLSNEDLIKEVLRTDVADEALVTELMNRALPGWQYLPLFEENEVSL